MSDFDVLAIAASGMQAQRAALDVAARNVAVAEAAGRNGSYERLLPDFSPVNSADDDSEAEGPSQAGAIAYRGAHPEKGSSVDVLTEMVSVLNASRAYEANASVFDLGKRLAERTIDLGRL
jgi:flagellar basal-body rod protein FlgC